MSDSFEYDPALFNSNTNANILDTVRKLTERYPIVCLWFKGLRVTDQTPAPVTVPLTREIWIPPSLLDSLNDDMDHELQPIISHEFAHVLEICVYWQAVGYDINRLPDHGIQQLLDRAYSGDDLSHPSSLATQLVAHGKSRFPDAHITPYAEQDALEFFAEAMRDYWTHPDSMEEISRLIGVGIDDRFLAVNWQPPK